MAIRLLFPYSTDVAGATVDYDNATEAALVAQGRAVYTTNPGAAFQPLTAQEQQAYRDSQPALSALVSEAGSVTAAAIRSTTGTPGQVVKLADGDDKGMLLQWLIPAGSTSYAWCWFLSPNDAY